MHRDNEYIGCLSGSVTRVGQELSGSITRIGQELCGSVTLVCSVNKEGLYWMWDAGEKLLWDNNIEIKL